MSKKALIIVDIQNDFLPGGALAVENGDEVVPVINRMQPEFDLVLATQDWHPAGHGSFASSHPGQKPYDVIDLEGQSQVLWPDHCVQDQPGADFPDTLDVRRIAAIFRKGTDPRVDSYSGFFDNNREHRTGMAGYLRDLEVTDIYVAGLASDYCVYFTAKDGYDLGFRVFYLDHASRHIADDTYQAALKDLREMGVKIIEGEFSL